MMMMSTAKNTGRATSRPASRMTSSFDWPGARTSPSRRTMFSIMAPDAKSL